MVSALSAFVEFGRFPYPFSRKPLAFSLILPELDKFLVRYANFGVILSVESTIYIVNRSPASGLKRRPVKTHNSEIIYLEKTQDPENHTLFSGTYPYRSNKGAPPPPELIYRK